MTVSAVMLKAVLFPLVLIKFTLGFDLITFDTKLCLLNHVVASNFADRKLKEDGCLLSI